MLHLVGMGSGRTAATIAAATIVLLIGLSGNATACACTADGSDPGSLTNATVVASMGAEIHTMANSTEGTAADVERRLSGLPQQIQQGYEEADRITDEAIWTAADTAMGIYGETMKHWSNITLKVEGDGDIRTPLEDRLRRDSSPPSEEEARDTLEKAIGERAGDDAEEELGFSQNSTARPEEAVNETVRSDSAGAFAGRPSDPEPTAPDPDDNTPPTRDMRPLVKTPEVAHEIPPAALVLMAATGLSLVAVLTVILSKTRFLARIIATGPLAGLFSRQTGRQVLQHPVRANIHAAITQNPGITSAALSEVTRCVPSTLRYHLDILRREDLIKVTRRGGVLHYHDVGARVDGQAQAREHLFWRDRGSLAITILQHPGANQKSVARITGLLPSRVSEYTKELAEAGLVRSERVGRYRQYFPTPMLQAMMADGQVPTSR